MRTTIKDIARETGLSITTVSMVLNGKGQKFSEEARRKVLAAAEALHYRPNQLAVSLLTKRTRTIGLILPDISNLYFSDLARGVEDHVQQSGYSLILCNTDDRAEKDLQSFITLTDRGVDGVVMIVSAENGGPEGAALIAALRASGVPVILTDSFDDEADFSSIAVDSFIGSTLAMWHLLDLGHRRIATITGPQWLNTNGQRYEGYVKCLEDAGIEVDRALVKEGDFRYQSGYRRTLELLPLSPTAIYCHNDMMALGAVRALKDSGRSVPEDISVVGYDDIFFSQYMDVPLTTVHQASYQMGASAAGMLLTEIERPGAPKMHVLMEPTLSVRGSTAPPPAGGAE